LEKALKRRLLEGKLPILYTQIVGDGKNNPQTHKREMISLSTFYKIINWLAIIGKDLTYEKTITL